MPFGGLEKPLKKIGGNYQGIECGIFYLEHSMGTLFYDMTGDNSWLYNQSDFPCEVVQKYQKYPIQPGLGDRSISYPWHRST